MLLTIILIILFVGTVFFLLQGGAFGKVPKGEAMERILKSPNYNGKTFFNPISTPMNIHIKAIWKDYRKSRKNEKKPLVEVPVHKLRPGRFSQKPSEALRVSWLGHSGMLIEMEGLRILVDPVLGPRASPFGFSGVKRLHETPLLIKDIPHIDLLLISHDHYDHMDMPVVKHFTGKKTMICVPLGLGATLRYWGILSENIIELDWHERYTMDGITITALPGRHFSGRRFRWRDKTLWCSWSVKGSKQSFYHSGDSGFFEGFREIGEGYGPFDLSMIGIGAYNELWHFIHTFPEEAIRAHEMLKARHLIPVHWATFNLALHPYLEPIQRLMACAKEKNISLLLPEIGEWVDVDNYVKKGYWWEKK